MILGGESNLARETKSRSTVYKNKSTQIIFFYIRHFCSPITGILLRAKEIVEPAERAADNVHKLIIAYREWGNKITQKEITFDQCKEQEKKPG